MLNSGEKSGVVKPHNVLTGTGSGGHSKRPQQFGAADYPFFVVRWTPLPSSRTRDP